MIEPVGVLKEGYRHIASLIFNYYETFRKNTDVPQEHTDILSQFEKTLARIANDGEVHELDADCFANVSQLFNNALPEETLPQNIRDTIIFSSATAARYMSIPSLDEFQERLHLLEIVEAPVTGFSLGWNNQQVGYRIRANYNEQRKACSLLDLLNTYLLIANRYYHEYQEILDKRTAFEGFDNLWAAIRNDTILDNQRKEAVNTGVDLFFYSSPQAMSLAQKTLMDFEGWAKYLSQNRAPSVFSHAMAYGYVPLQAMEAVHDHPLTDHDGFSAAYCTLAGARALNSVFNGPKQRLSLVGIGLVGYCFGHPEDKDKIHSPAFIDELITNYFEVAFSETEEN